MYETFSIRKATGENVSRVAVVFSSVNANGFSFYNLFEQFEENLHRIYIRDPYDQWYDQGVSEEITTWPALVAEIQRGIKNLGVKDVMIFGASMGGYASLKLASQIKAHTCIAISPQTLLDLRLPHTPKKPVAPENSDLRHSLNPWQPNNAAVFLGAADFVDIFNVFRIDWNGADIFPIEGKDHLVAQFLLQRRVMRAMINDFASKGAYTPNLRLKDRKVALDRACFDTVQGIMINRVVEGFYLGAGWDVLAHLRALSALKMWADGLHLEAKILARKGKTEEALKAADKALSLAPSSVTVSDTYAGIYRSAGRLEEAISGYRRSLELRSKHYQALCCLGELLQETGNEKEAAEMLRQAVEVRPRQVKAQAIAETLNIDLDL
ncbi:MAG: tetratricopeptide repeat protein [Sulfitobacter sp.]